MNELTPGPGTYDFFSSVDSPSFSFSNTRKEPKILISPGPGHYNPIEKSQKKVISYHIPKSKKTSSYFSQSPGPGSYNIKTPKDSSAYKIGKAERFHKSQKEIFGYQNNENIQNNESIKSIKNIRKIEFLADSKHSLIEKNTLPGPGSYSPQYKYKSIQFSLGQSKKNSFKPLQGPGPGSYSINSYKAVSVIFGSTPRVSLYIDNENPGSGTYETKTFIKTPRHTLKKQ